MSKPEVALFLSLSAKEGKEEKEQKEEKVKDPELGVPDALARADAADKVADRKHAARERPEDSSDRWFVASDIEDAQPPLDADDPIILYDEEA